MTGFDVSRRRISVSKNSGNLLSPVVGSGAAATSVAPTTMPKASITTRRKPKAIPFGAQPPLGEVFRLRWSDLGPYRWRRAQQDARIEHALGAIVRDVALLWPGA